MIDVKDTRPNNREVENENMRPAGDGKPPRRRRQAAPPGD